MRYVGHVLLAAATLVVSFPQQPSVPPHSDVSAQIRIVGDVTTPLTLSAGDLKNLPRKTVKVVNPHENKEETYEGVSVQELLRRAGVPQHEKLRGAAMTMYVLAEASDGYRVVYALAELDSDFQDR